MNAKEWLKELAETQERLRNGQISVQSAMASSKLANSVSTVISAELTYRKMRGECPEMEFFEK